MLHRRSEALEYYTFRTDLSFKMFTKKLLSLKGFTVLRNIWGRDRV